MKLSIVQSAQLHQWFRDLEALQKSNDDAGVYALFGRLALIADGIVCKGWRGWFRKRPSSMDIAEFLGFIGATFPRLVQAVADDRSLIEKLVKLKLT